MKMRMNPPTSLRKGTRAVVRKLAHGGPIKSQTVMMVTIRAAAWDGDVISYLHKEREGNGEETVGV